MIVALDGLRVRSRQQLQAIVAFDDRDEMAFTVWREGKYVDIKATVIDRYLGLKYETFKGADA